MCCVPIKLKVGMEIYFKEVEEAKKKSEAESAYERERKSKSCVIRSLFHYALPNEKKNRCNSAHAHTGDRHC